MRGAAGERQRVRAEEETKNLAGFLPFLPLSLVKESATEMWRALPHQEINHTRQRGWNRWSAG